jgi:hypothetical protein
MSRSNMSYVFRTAVHDASQTVTEIGKSGTVKWLADIGRGVRIMKSLPCLRPHR